MMAKLKKSPNDLSVLFEQILLELSEILITESEELTSSSRLISWDLGKQSHRERISEMLVAGMRCTSGWFLNLGDDQFMEYSDSYVSEWARKKSQK